MTEIYLIRHCEAEGNKKRIVQGIIDTEITEIGERQLEFLSKRFENIKLDAVFASPLKRTMATAHAVADTKGLPVITAEDFIEMNCGILEGRPFEEIFKEKELVDIWVNRPQNMDFEGGETQKEVYERIWGAVKRLACENEGKTVAVATHGGVLRALFCRLKLGSLDRLVEMPYATNTAVSLLRFNGDEMPELVFMNDDSHLPEEYLPQDSKVPTMEEKQS